MNHFDHRQRTLGIIALAGASAIWGGMYVATAALMRQTPPLVVLELREAIAGLILVPIAWRSGRLRIARGDLALAAAIGIVGFTVSIGLQLEGTHIAGAALGSLITASSPVLIALLGRVWLRERLPWPKLVAILVAVGGVALIAGHPPGGPQVEPGIIDLAGAALAWAIYTVGSAHLTRRYDALGVLAIACIVGSVTSLPFALASASHAPNPLPTTLVAWLEVAYISIAGMALAFFLWNWGFGRVDAAVGGSMLLFQPLVGVVLGIVSLAEPITLTLVFGGLLVVAGVSGAVAIATPRVQLATNASPEAPQSGIRT